MQSTQPDSVSSDVVKPSLEDVVAYGQPPAFPDYKRRYGLDWNKNIPDVIIDLTLWKKWREEPFRSQAEFLDPVSEHVLRACSVLFTPDQLRIHEWFEQQALSWTLDEFAIWWGCAGSGKSLAMGLFCLLDYLVDIDVTFALLASTTKLMLEQRSFAYVKQYLAYLEKNPRFELPLRTYDRPSLCVVPKSAVIEELGSLRGKILGVAVSQGTQQESRQKLQGVHTNYVRWLLDELSGLRPAAMDAAMNLSQCPDFKLIGAANPESFYGQEGIYAEPKAGWTSLDPDKDFTWESNYGKVYRFDAFKSPGLEDPVSFPFLPTRSSIKRMLEQQGNNMDAPAVWTFLRAFPPPQGSEQTIISEKEVEVYRCREDCYWAEPPRVLAAFDPAYSESGDKPLLRIAYFGVRSPDQVPTLHFGQTFMLKIKASSDLLVVQQLLQQLQEYLFKYNVRLQDLAVDDSAIQNFADICEIHFQQPGALYRFSNNAKPPPIPYSPLIQDTSDRKFRDSITWAAWMLRAFAVNDHIRGLDKETVRQLVMRKYLPKRPVWQLEPKDEIKKRLHHSPDEGDTALMLCAMLVQRLGFMPGERRLPSGSRFFMHAMQSGSFPAGDERRIREINNLDLLQGRYQLHPGKKF